MPTMPPVGSGLARVLLNWAASRDCWNDRNCAATGWSIFCHCIEVTQRASNFDSDRSMSAWASAGSMANARIASVPPRPREPTPNWAICSFLKPGLFGAWLPMLPCSSASATHSRSVMLCAGRVKSRTVLTGPPRWSTAPGVIGPCGSVSSVRGSASWVAPL